MFSLARLSCPSISSCRRRRGRSASAKSCGCPTKAPRTFSRALRWPITDGKPVCPDCGEGKVAEIDGAYFWGHVRPENLAADRIDRRLAENQSGKRKVVVVMRERDGRTLPQVFASEDAAVSFIRARIAKGTVVHADESPAWNSLHAKFSMKRVNHQQGYSIDGACTNGAELYFSRMRRGELGHHHHIAGVYFIRYAQEAAWREDHRGISNGDQVHGVIGLAMGLGPSVDFCGYWQRAAAA